MRRRLQGGNISNLTAYETCWSSWTGVLCAIAWLQLDICKYPQGRNGNNVVIDTNGPCTGRHNRTSTDLPAIFGYQHHDPKDYSFALENTLNLAWEHRSAEIGRSFRRDLHPWGILCRWCPNMATCIGLWHNPGYKGVWWNEASHQVHQDLDSGTDRRSSTSGVDTWQPTAASWRVLHLDSRR